MLNKLKDILNTYTTQQLEDMSLWVNSSDGIYAIIVDDENIDLITSDSEIKINDYISKERK